MRLFALRQLDFDFRAAEAHARITERALASGKPLPVADAFIAAIAAVHGFAVATRDVAPFEAAGVEVINPFH